MKKEKLKNRRQGWLQKDSRNSLVSTMVKYFSPIERLYIVRTILTTTNQHKWNVFQLDVKYYFLNGIL